MAKIIEEVEGPDCEGQEMSQEELDAVVDELEEDPIDEDNKTRTYEIWKTADGTVRARRLPRKDLREGGLEEEARKRVSGTNEKDREERTGQLTELGSDPPAPGPQPDPERSKILDKKHEPRKELSMVTHDSDLEKWMDCVEEPEDQTDEFDESIKERSSTYLEETMFHPLETTPPHTQTSLPPTNIPQTLQTLAVVHSADPRIQAGLGSDSFVQPATTPPTQTSNTPMNPPPTPRPPVGIAPTQLTTKHEDLEERERERCLAEALNISFPPQQNIEGLPLLAWPYKGLLAAQELTPIARYDGPEDIGFYAKSVTIVWNNDQGEPAYYQGDALIRVSQRDTRPGPKYPSRRSIKIIRDWLFRPKAQAPNEVDKRTKPPEIPNLDVYDMKGFCGQNSPPIFYFILNTVNNSVVQ